MYTARGRAGFSKLAVPVALIVILVVAGGYLFLTRGSTSTNSTQSSSATSQPTVPLRTAVNQLIQDINDRNVDGVVTFYSQDSTVVWSGDVGGLKGMYSPVGNIKLIYATTVGKSTSMDANVSNYAENEFSPRHVNTTFVITLLGNSTVAGVVRATIDVSQEWNWGSGGWQISKENWAYARFDSSFIDAGVPSATTFPQWGYMEKGGNPNLVSEKSFEWHAGPYVATSVYAFLFGVVALFALRLRSRDGGAPREEPSAKVAAQGVVPGHDGLPEARR